MEWNEYQKSVFETIKRLYPDANVFHDVRLPGRLSRTERQIDILIVEIVAVSIVDIVVDTKYLNENIDVKKVEEFLGLLTDVGCEKGILVTNVGYSDAAINRATRNPFDIGIEIVSFAELKEYQGEGAIAWKGPHGALILPPLGWAVDCRPETGAFVASLFSRTKDRESAFKEQEFLYLSFESKDSFPSLDDLTNFQEENMKKRIRSGFQFSYGDWRMGDNTYKMRTVYIPPLASIEYTAFREFQDFFAYGVLITPIAKYKTNLAKMLYTMHHLVPLKVTDTNAPSRTPPGQ